MQSRAELDSALVSRIEFGEGEAEAELFERFSVGVKLMLLQRTGNAQLASDLTQDTFIVVLRRLRAGELKNPAGLPKFISQTAIYISNDHFRRERRYVYQESEMFSLQVTHRDYKAEKLDSGKARELLEQILDQLTMDRDRELLSRFYLKDEDKAKICRDLDLSAAHFDRVLYRAKSRMRELIDKEKDLKSLLFGGLFDG